MNWFLKDNCALARALRTAVQGALSTLITWASSGFNWDSCVLMATMVPVVLSPIMAALGSGEGTCWLFSSDNVGARALRSSIQGALSTVSAWATAGFAWSWMYLLAAMIPAVLAPVMGVIGEVDSSVG